MTESNQKNLFTAIIYLLISVERFFFLIYRSNNAIYISAVLWLASQWTFSIQWNLFWAQYFVQRLWVERTLLILKNAFINKTLHVSFRKQLRMLAFFCYRSPSTGHSFFSKVGQKIVGMSIPAPWSMDEDTKEFERMYKIVKNKTYVRKRYTGHNSSMVCIIPFDGYE